ncbi:MAG: hypothetical protein KDK76_02155 [Chlamydiia bacterium]|nr:hypothetical protein [Chlamydiia bacterium]
MEAINKNNITNPSSAYPLDPEKIRLYLERRFEGESIDIKEFTEIPESLSWKVVVSDALGMTKTLYFSHEYLQRELDAESSNQIANPASLNIEGKTSYHVDGFTKISTDYFTTHPEVKEESLTEPPGIFSARPHLVVAGESVLLTKGLSWFEEVIYGFFFPEKIQAWNEQNRQTIRIFKNFLDQECGEGKRKQIESRYDINLDAMEKAGTPLEPKHIYYFNIGMNNIEMEDVESLRQRIENKTSLTNRERRGIKKYGSGADTTNLINILRTPAEAQENVYTGRKFKEEIRGSYNRSIKDRETFRPWIDQQELLQTFHDIENPPTTANKDDYFQELLSKVVVKKHLIRSDREGNWKVGAIIPSPYKDDEGKTVYYKVQQGVDSGKGKYWVVLAPADDNASKDLPIIRVARDTCSEKYPQRGVQTIVRDVQARPGYLYHDSTEEEDRAFFKTFTLPSPLAALAAFEKRPLDETRKALISSLPNEMKNAALDKMTNDTLLSYVQLSLKTKYPDDWALYEAVVVGNPPRRVLFAGTSLGGFDTQQTFVQQTAHANRVPVTNFGIRTQAALQISKEDDEQFTTFFQNNHLTLEVLGLKYTIKHVVEDVDSVSNYPAGTFLGDGLQQISLPQNTSQINLTVYNVSSELRRKDPHFSRLSPHSHRFEGKTERGLTSTTPKIQDFVEKAKKRPAKGPFTPEDAYNAVQTLPVASLAAWHAQWKESKESSKKGMFYRIPEGHETTKMVSTIDSPFTFPRSD